MGAHLVPDGATFRVWAPAALAVHLTSPLSGWEPTPDNLLTRDGEGRWAGFWPGVTEGLPYKFFVSGHGSQGYNRDPYARELAADCPGRCFPFVDCLVRDPGRYPWHDANWRPPAFHELVIYQLHVGTFYSPLGGRQPGRFLDIATRLPYLASLGISALQLLPIVEFHSQFSMGYNGTDYFSPENDYAVPRSELPARLDSLNALLTSRRPGATPFTLAHLEGSADQLRCLVDLAHLHGIAVLFDVVYNHAGGDWGEGSIYFFDRQPFGNNNDSLYFTDRGHAGGLCFAAWKPEVRQFLIDNALFLLEEYHADGLRHDQVSVLDHENAGSGWMLCQHLVDTCRFRFPGTLQHAEYWPVNPSVVQSSDSGGAGFDTCYHDGLRDAVRSALAQAAMGASARVELSKVRDALWPAGMTESWRGVHNLETHDEVYRDRFPRIARLADGLDSRSWFAVSRSRVALGLLLTAPGTPMLFMGQEFLEDKPWADDVENHPHLRIHWKGLEDGDRTMTDFLRCSRDLIALRRSLPGLQGEGFHAFYVHDDHRVLAFHRWVPGTGADVVVVASLAEQTWENYRIGFPGGGHWHEVFNSDAYSHFPNPQVRGNAGNLVADGAHPIHGLPASASLVIPANGLLVFTR
jgi:1,4-alpha-glucan branching enzyme